MDRRKNVYIICSGGHSRGTEQVKFRAPDLLRDRWGSMENTCERVIATSFQSASSPFPANFNWKTQRGNRRFCLLFSDSKYLDCLFDKEKDCVKGTSSHIYFNWLMIQYWQHSTPDSFLGVSSNQTISAWKSSGRLSQKEFNSFLISGSTCGSCAVVTSSKQSERSKNCLYRWWIN